jgi:hypothetical protein
MQQARLLILIAAIVFASLARGSELPMPIQLKVNHWNKRVASDLRPGTASADAQAYFRANGMESVKVSADRKSLTAEQDVELKRYWPAFGTPKTLRVECALDARERLKACSVVVTTDKCCGR